MERGSVVDAQMELIVQQSLIVEKIFELFDKKIRNPANLNFMKQETLKKYPSAAIMQSL